MNNRTEIIRPEVYEVYGKKILKLYLEQFFGSSIVYLRPPLHTSPPEQHFTWNGKPHPRQTNKTMHDIPVTFEHNGVQYSGHLSPVHGAGQNIWHLYVNKYFLGRLRYHHDWVFDSIKMPEIAGQLGEYVIAWRQ